MSVGYVALSAVFFGLVGPFINIMGTNPVVAALLTSLTVGVVHGTTGVANLARCNDVRVAPSWAVLTAGWLFAAMRIGLFLGYVLLPVSLALPLFYTWVPMAAAADYLVTTKGGESYRGSILSAKDVAMRAGLTTLGAAVLVASERFQRRSVRTVVLGVVLVVLAAAANAARVIVTKYSLLMLSANDRVAASNWLLAAAAGLVFVRHPEAVGGMTLTQLLIWIAFGLGLYIATANVMNELEHLSVSDVAFTLLLELFVAVIAGVVVLGEYRTARMLTVAGVELPVAKILGLAAIVLAVVDRDR